MSGGPVGILRRCHCLSTNAGAEGATREFDATQPTFNPDQSTCEAASPAAALQHFGGREIKFRSTASLNLPTSYADHYTPKVRVDSRRPAQSTQPLHWSPHLLCLPHLVIIYTLRTNSQQGHPSAKADPLCCQPNTSHLQSPPTCRSADIAGTMHLQAGSRTPDVVQQPAPVVQQSAQPCSPLLSLQPLHPHACCSAQQPSCTGVTHVSWRLRTERPSKSGQPTGRRRRRSPAD